MPRLRLVLPLVLFATAACASDGPATAASGGEPSGSIVVFAASSLTEAFTEIGAAFTAAHPQAEVTFNFAGSADLVAQIGQGAPADVFASADDANMSKLVAAGENAGDAVTIAENTMEILVEKGNPKGIATVADLTEPGLVVVLCADAVPCGKSAAKVLQNAGVTIAPKSLEDKVKGIVTKVTAGEADAGIVYVSDVQAVGDAAAGVPIPAGINVVNAYPMVVTKEAQNPRAAAAFVDFVASAPGQAILASHGFLAP